MNRITMSRLGWSAALCLSLASPGAIAASEGNSQQNKMATCNKEAGDKALKGEERKAFMSQCLSAKPATPQERMKACNKQAGDKALKGEERKAFMSQCLKA